MRSALKYLSVIVVLAMLSGCAGLPAATAPAPTASGPVVPEVSTPAPAVTAAPAGSTGAIATVAPAATAAPGSTEGAPTLDPAASPASAMPPARDEPRPTATLSPDATVAPVVTAAPTIQPAPTEALVAIDCTPGALTPGQTEGPYYTANPPETDSLFQPGMSGTKLLLTGYVLDEQCRPIPGARVDFWQADAQGVYDNQGYTLRGYQLTDAEGRYSMATVVPGEYPGRTPHIHVKITPPGGKTLTSQLYLPGAAANQADRIFSPELVADIAEGPGGMTGTFNFVVRAQ